MIEKIENVSITPREKEVLELLCEGFTYKEIASKLFISDVTVKAHMNNVFIALDVSEKHQAVVYVNKFGLPAVRYRKSPDIQEVKALFKSGLSAQEVRKKLKISSAMLNTAKNMLKAAS